MTAVVENLPASDWPNGPDHEFLESPPLQKRPKREELRRQFPITELYQLRETNQLFQSNVFNLQVNELLREVTVGPKVTTFLENYVIELGDLFRNLENTEPMLFLDAVERVNQHLKFPLDLSIADKKCRFGFIPPSKVEFIGSYAIGCMLNTGVVDIGVTIPDESFEKHDNLNFRLFKKKALYICHLAIALKRNSSLCTDVEFRRLNGESLLPILKVTPPGNIGYPICIHAILPRDIPATKVTKFPPDKSNIQYDRISGDFFSVKSIPPTPHYNSLILQDVMMDPNQKFLECALKDIPGLRKALILLKVWLNQRGISCGFGAWSGFIMSMFVVGLSQKRQVTKTMSPYLIFRNTLLDLTKLNLSKVTLCKTHSELIPILDTFTDRFVIIDPSGHLNILASLSQATFLNIIHEARLGISILDNCSSLSAFEHLFLTKIEFDKKHDQFVTLKTTDKLNILSDNLLRRMNCLDYGEDVVSFVLYTKLVRFLVKGLGDRIKVITVLPTAPVNWSLDSVPPKVESVTIGLVLNEENFSRSLDKGPPADDPNAVDFRSFWGQRSELRRFADGTIHEAILWTQSDLVEDHRNVAGEVIRYIADVHFGVSPDDWVYSGGRLNGFVGQYEKSKLDHTSFSNKRRSPASEERHYDVVKSFDELKVWLATMEGLPLGITSIQGVSPVLRFSETTAPIPLSGYTSTHGVSLPTFADDKLRSPWLPSIEMVCHLGFTGKWPQHPDAVKCVKAAFYLRIAHLLEGEKSLKCHVFVDYLLVFKDGFVFKIVTFNPKDLKVYRDACLDGIADSLHITANVIPKTAVFLQHMQYKFPLYSLTCRLARQWVACQLMFHTLNEIVIDMLVAHVFLSPKPYMAPVSGISGFARFLNLLATIEWKTTFLVLDFNGDMERLVTEAMDQQFKDVARRKRLPGLVIVTPADSSGVALTSVKPTELLLHRLCYLAGVSLAVLQSTFEGHLEVEPEMYSVIFRPCLDSYDVVIRLNHSCLPRRYENVDSNMARVKPGSVVGGQIPVVDFDPLALYVRELMSLYGHVAMFFYNPQGGDTVGVVWIPVKKMDYKIGGSMLEGHKLVPNYQAIVEDFWNIGEHLVKEIELRTERWKV